MSKLKKCPFCGSEESEWQDHPSDCYLKMITKQVESDCKCYSKEACESAWNTRPIEDELVKDIDVLCKEIDQLNSRTLELLENNVSLANQVMDDRVEIERLKDENERWRVLLFKTAEKYVKDVLNADGDVCIDLLVKALAAPPQKENE